MNVAIEVGKKGGNKTNHTEEFPDHAALESYANDIFHRTLYGKGGDTIPASTTPRPPTKDIELFIDKQQVQDVMSRTSSDGKELHLILKRKEGRKLNLSLESLMEMRTPNRVFRAKPSFIIPEGKNSRVILFWSMIKVKSRETENEDAVDLDLELNQ